MGKRSTCWPQNTLLWLVVAAALWMPWGAVVCAGGGPENTVLVVNQNHRTSMLIANYYIAWRHIPASHVIYLDNVPNRTVITLESFQGDILKPIIDQIQARGLTGQIDAIVYSDGFPTSVQIGPHIKKLEEQLSAASGTPRDLGRIFNPRASLTSLTYFAPAVLADDPSYLSLDANWYYRSPAKQLLTNPFLGDEQAHYDEALREIAADDWQAALQILEPLQARHPQQLAVLFQLARVTAALGQVERSAEWMTLALAEGWTSRRPLTSDEHLGPLLSDPRWTSIVERLTDETMEFAPTRAFQMRHCWNPSGAVNASNDQGRHFVLCTMLTITGDNGNSESQALNQIRSSTAADGSMPDGTFVFTLTGDVRTTTRRAQFAAAVQALQALGHQAEIVSSDLPQNLRIAGASIGTATFDWRQSQSEILPGAICENLTSLGGRYDHAAQTKLTEFLRYGAAGSSGTVIEPFTVPNKFPNAMIHVHYARGCSLAEAYYQSVAGPFQLLIVGDALCQPWARFPQFDTGGWSPPESCTGVLTIPLFLKPASPAVSSLEIYLDGQLKGIAPWQEQLNFDTASLSDGYHELRLVAVGEGPIFSRSRVIVQFWIDNLADQVTLSTTKAEFDESETLSISLSTNIGDRIQLRHNRRLLGELSSSQGELRIPATTLGRGPVQLQAVATDDSGFEVASRPLSLLIQGEISAEIPRRTPSNQDRQRQQRGGGRRVNAGG